MDEKEMKYSGCILCLCYNCKHKDTCKKEATCKNCFGMPTIGCKKSKEGKENE